MAYNPKDHYYKKAKQNNYVARSIFKLEEIDQRYKIFKKGQKILDLGAAPGSWSQYSTQAVGPSGFVYGIDLSRIALTFPNAEFLQADIHSDDAQKWIQERGPFDMVLSDMAPKTTGIKVTDQARSEELCRMAMDAAEKYLKQGGTLVIKFFHSEEFKTLVSDLKKRYKKVHFLRPDSTRKSSKEIFIISQNKES